MPESDPHSSRYRAALWLRNRHLQTVWGRVARSRRQVATRREVVTTPDGDDLVLDHLDGDPGAARILFLHGLEGSSNSVYVQGMLSDVARLRLSATVLNFRACARHPESVSRTIPNRGRRLYHSGETSDLRHVVEMLASRAPDEERFAIGVSLGGNVLLKYLGEEGSEAPLKRAATISVPYDLAAGARYLDSGLGRIYVRTFVRSLTRKAEYVCRLHNLQGIDLERGRRATTFHEFDDAVTAPLHGFASADQYYEESSSISFLSRIRIPVLCINASDDPFLPPETLLRAQQCAAEQVRFVVTPRGGHAGFVYGAPWRSRYWAEEAAVRFVTSGEPAESSG